MPLTCTAEVLVSVHCVVAKANRAGIDKRLPLRPLPQPESIKIVLDETGNFEKCLSVDSVVCNSCYLFCKRLLQQCGEDVRPAESIMQSLKAKVMDLKERLHQCMAVAPLAANLLGFQHVESGCQKSHEFVRPHSIRLDNRRWEARV